jgi:hypothetical protein
MPTPAKPDEPASIRLGSRSDHFLPWRNARRVFSAVRVFNQKFGLVMNVHATLQYLSLGITDPAAASALLSAFNQAAGRWVARQARKYDRGDWSYGYTWVHERTLDRGLHTHQLMFIPPNYRLHQAFETWAQGWLKKRTGAAYAKDALFLQKRVYRHEADQVDRQWRWVGYILKSVEDQWVTDQGRRVSILDYLKITPDIRQPTWPVECAQRSGASHNLGVEAFDGEFMEFMVGPSGDEILAGWDLDEYRRRIRQQEQDRDIAEAMRSIRI